MREKKDLQLFALNLTEKIKDPDNAKNHYQSYLKNKSANPVKR